MALKINAIADLVTPGWFRVEVWDIDNENDRVVYDLISAASERAAAFQGIERFQAEREKHEQEE